MTMLFDARWIGAHGIGRFAKEVRDRLSGFDDVALGGVPSRPLDPLALSLYLRATRSQLFFSPGYNCPLWYRGRYIFTVHDLNHITVGKGSSTAKRAYYREVIRPGIRAARAVLTVSEFSRTALLDWTGVGEDRVINVSNGTSAEFSRDGYTATPCAGPYVLAIGARKWHKNLEGAITGFARSGRTRDVNLVITGSPHAHLVQLIDELQLRDRVTFTGSVSDRELAALYRGAIALMFVSHYEGFGLPMLEAMACGTPVLAANTSALPEVAGSAALLVDPSSSEAIGAALRALIDDGALRTALTERGLLHAQAFSWNKTSAKIHAVVERCMQS